MSSKSGTRQIQDAEAQEHSSGEQDVQREKPFRRSRSRSRGRVVKHPQDDVGKVEEDVEEIELTDDDEESGYKSERPRSKKGRFTASEFINKSREIHSRYISERTDRSWSRRYKFGQKLIYGWKKFWNWWIWKLLLRNIPYILSLLMILFGTLIAFSGPITNIWVIELKAVKYGAWGGCQDGGKCSTEIFYDGPEIGNWSNKTLPLLLLCFGIVASIQLLFLIYTYIFIRHRFISHCCSDPESQSSSSTYAKQRRKRGIRSIKWFERIMDLSSIGYLTLSLVLTAWISESNSDGLTGYNLAICLAISPFIWLFFRLFYRSKWLYNKTAKKVHKTQSNEIDEGEEETDSEDEEDAYDNIVYDRSGREEPDPRRYRSR
ncbi:uncharacterized protein L201_006680 [Kwoniella dendrophila CBS 6074]|uniref:Uncharacterized protein n=1 Tax=Kwoniella dendrophila CBS 6074 TaxID=1295534 RepID=A0AAX4K3I8_9TREE